MKLSIVTHAKVQLMRLLTSLLAPPRTRAALLLVLGGLLLGQAPALAQGGTGTLKGTVTQSVIGTPLVGVIVTVNGTSIKGVTNTHGVYSIENVPAGPQTVTFRWLGYRPVQATATVTAKGTTTLDAKMEQLPIQLSELTVTGASKVPERAVEAPAAFSIVEPRVLQAVGITGQVPLALREVPGVDIVQSGMNDFNVNARGFNSSLNRRVLVLQDGRDLAIAFLGAQEWNAMPVPTDEFSKMELVRGPGSALYGANAFSGVLNITTPSAREVAGTKLTLGGGLMRPHRQDGTAFSGNSLRADGRTAGVLLKGRLGYRLNAGYNESDSWSRSRTATDCLDMRREYAEAVEDTVAHPVQRSCEVRPLQGQTAGSGGAVSGEPDPTRNIYGSGRLEYYLNDGSVLTGEAGTARVQNELFVTGIGRVQVTEAWRPYGRVAWASKGFNVMAYWNARNGGRLGSSSKQFAQASGALLREKSNIFHVEAQDIRNFAGDKARVVFGGSARNYRVNTSGTLMRPKVGPTGDDDRSDYFYATFAQLEYQFSPQVRGVAAARVDIGSLMDPQFSPKLGIVFSPNERHSFRATMNRAFQLPNYSEFFLAVPAGAPANLSALEAGLRASALGPALAGVPVGQLFACVTISPTCPTPNSSAVPVVARGNANLIPETTLGFELGYRGDVSRNVYLTLDAYFNRIRNFVTDLLPGINTVQYPYWTAPTAVPASARQALVSAVRANLASSPTAQLGLSRDLAGNTAIILSYGNAGKVTQWGLEAGAGWQIIRELRTDATLTLFDYSVDQDQVAKGDSLLANTPSAKGSISLSFANRGLSAATSLRIVKGYPWAAGVFAGFIESNSTLDANVGYDLNNNFKVFVTGTNVLDNRKFTIYGGSVNGRRILGGVTTRF
jgi:outer membrane receptor protein involved in Fe transport